MSDLSRIHPNRAQPKLPTSLANPLLVVPMVVMCQLCIRHGPLAGSPARRYVEFVRRPAEERVDSGGDAWGGDVDLGYGGAHRKA